MSENITASEVIERMKEFAASDRAKEYNKELTKAIIHSVITGEGLIVHFKKPTLLKRIKRWFR